MIKATLFYLDSQEVNIQLYEADLPKFLENVKAEKLWWTNDEKVGLYVPLEKVRLIRFEKVIDQGDKDVPQATHFESCSENCNVTQ